MNLGRLQASFDDACRARLPREALPLLARLRTEVGVRAALTERHVWLRWEPGNERVLAVVMPIEGAILYQRIEGDWHRLGRLLADLDVPRDLEEKPLAHVLFPAPLASVPPPTLTAQPMSLTLAPDDAPRLATAMLAPTSTMLAWSDSVPTARLAKLTAACLGESLLILGERLPLLERSERFWGSQVLVPLGLAPVPALPESALREAAQVEEDALLLLRPSRAEAIERELFSPLTRAGLRLAAREVRA